jgi:uncharacterized membrane protein
MQIVVFATTLFVAMIAGLFYSFSCSVTAGLGKLQDAEYLRAMQSINSAILNPWFFMSFLGALVMLPICTWFVYRHGTSTSFYCFLSATIIYFIAVFGVTVLKNVPLNEALDKFDTGAATVQEIKMQRSRFEIPWNRFNLVRTIASLLSLVLVLIAIDNLIRKA